MSVGRPSFDAFDQLGLSLDRVQEFLPIFNFSLPNSVVAAISLMHHEASDHRYVRRLARLAVLAPEIVEAIVAGNQPPELTAEALAGWLCALNDGSRFRLRASSGLGASQIQ